ncbi:unnamed protein product [Rotaria sp. Silwood1]|nr:unnamed protein product [Rotaria sp. Silwood1]
MCGNKTDKCPNCKQYVRRAIFAYHYENNCDNPDAPTTNNETNQNTQHPTQSNQVHESDGSALIPCEYCNQGISWGVYDNHTGQVNDAGRLISCSFCNNTFTSTKEMGDHLLLCGNKTDQCPNCKKFIRRAMFAYHYENNCADVDAIDKDANPTVDTSVASSLPSTRSAASNEKHITIMKVDLGAHSSRENPTFQRSNSGRL